MSVLLSQSAAALRQRSLSCIACHLNNLNASCNVSAQRKYYDSAREKSGTKFTYWKQVGIVTGAIVGGYGIYKYSQPTSVGVQAKAKQTPVYSSSDVAEHKTLKDKVWVSYKDGVYDITDFVRQHPGGNKIMLGAGGAIDPFWNLYAVHKTDEVLEILESYRIGDLKKEDQKSHKSTNDPFGNEPYRFPVFRVNSEKPFNAEPPLEVLTDAFITPNEMFYVRNHLPVPDVDPQTFRLEVVSAKGKSIKYSLEDLQKFPWITVTTTIQCAGNRREEMSKFKKVKGLSWGASAIGTAQWTGPRLRDVLLASGFNPEDSSIKHIQFDGLDCDITNSCYGASIPVKKALSREEDVILAVKMNGEDIPRDHGFPVRAIVPGVVGARNVKWTHRVVASDEESSSHWQQKDYKVFNPSTTYETADYSKTPAIQDLPVTSAITWPTSGSSVEITEEGNIHLSGYAWSGGGRDIIRVDVTADGGRTWKEAELIKNTKADDSSKAWPWTLWEIEMPVKEGKIEIACKAIDASYNTQPETIDPIWNLRGFLSNAWHRVRVQVVKEEE